MKTRKRNEGFTLVEILIVVVILGILAAIVIPQFTQASTEAREASLRSNLQSIRSQIELYKIQHLDTPPPVLTFEAVMIVRGADGMGPYMQAVPANPFSAGSNTVGAAGNGAWAYTVDLVTNEYTFTADDGGQSPNGGPLHSDL